MKRFKLRPRKDIKKLKRKLLRRGGNAFQNDWYLHDQIDRGLCTALLKRGFLDDGRLAHLRKMRRSQCHDNSLRLVQKHPNWTMYTGLALSEDGIWRVHSWVTTRRTLIETTVPRELYFGVPVIDW